jgi:hypothetical protein
MRQFATFLILLLGYQQTLPSQVCPPPITLSSAIRVADYVFIGRVLEAIPDSVPMAFGGQPTWYSPVRRVTFTVLHQWLGVVKDTVQLRTDPMDSAYTAKVGRIPLSFALNTEYLVFASSGGTFVSGKDTVHYRALIDRPWTNDCMGTRLASTAVRWVTLLNRDPIEILEIDTLVR